MSESSSILLIPDEIFLRIFQSSVLAVKDICNLAVVCKRFESVCLTQSLWRRKFSERWPWIWKQLMKREAVIDDWKGLTFTVQNFSHRLRNQFSFVSERLYNYEHVIAPVWHSILDLFPSKEFGFVFLYAELRRIIFSSNHPINFKPTPENDGNDDAQQDARDGAPMRQHGLRPNWQKVLPAATTGATSNHKSIRLAQSNNLTESYYSRKLIKFAHIEICKDEWNAFLSIPSANQSLEVGATLVEKWMDCNVDLSTETVTCQIDDLAKECHEYLQSIHPNHPACSVPLRSINAALEDTLWNACQSKQIFYCVNYILYEKHKFEGNTSDYYAKENSCISQVLSRKKGIPITLCIIYAAICHRLGVALQPLNFPRHFVLRWKIPNSKGEYEFIDAFGNGKKMTKSELIVAVHSILQININPDDVETDLVSPPNEVFRRMANNLLMLFRDSGHLENVWLALELLAFISPNHEKENDLLYGLFGIYARLEINFDRIVEGCSQYLLSDPSLPIAQSILAMKEEFQSLLAEQQRKPKDVLPKVRTGESKVTFATGMIMKHKLYHYICVIYGWDPVCSMSEEWILRMNVRALKKSRNQPFYNVLAMDGSIRYAAEENLLQIQPTLVTHPQIGKYFQAFNGAYYMPNEQLRKRYPEDEGVARKFYSNYFL